MYLAHEYSKFQLWDSMSIPQISGYKLTFLLKRKFYKYPIVHPIQTEFLLSKFEPFIQSMQCA